MNACQIARAIAVPRSTVQEWLHRADTPDAQAAPRCWVCSTAAEIDGRRAARYCYLLGLYLGDGCLSMAPRDVWKLRIVLDLKYPLIIDECAMTLQAVSKGRPAGMQRLLRRGYAEVSGYWKHWPCVFPQHGPGRKHERPIELHGWQQELVARHPGRLLRGLVHSDGCRFLNRVKGKGYPRYMFTNVSDDIRRIFCQACDDYGVAWRQSNWRTISVARALDVARLDLAVGPKA